MPKCEYYGICGRDALEDTGKGLCILHSESEGKDEEAFKKALAEHRTAKGDNFGRFVFPGCANFEGNTFTAGADFTRVVFTKEAIFSDATFTAGAEFGEATFAEEAYFDDATFANGEAHFYGATFTKEAIFSRAKCTAGADFTGATFSRGADFAGTEFTNHALFFGASFLGRTVFSLAKGKETSSPIFSGTEVDFRGVDIAPLDSLIFRDVDLTRCRFEGTDLRKAEITGAKWAPIRGRFGVYDEVVDPLVDGETRSWHHIEKVYRELKQNYEDRRDYERARDFHYGEKEMRRKHAKTLGRRFWGLRALLFIYKWVSGYGEHILCPFVWAVILLGGCSVLYLWFGPCPKGENTRLAFSSLWDWLRSAHYSLRVMFLLKPDDFVPIGGAKLVHTAETILGPLLIGLFGLAVRQRLKR